MRLTQTLETRQQQSQRIDPRQILASEILAWNTQELEAAVERELSDNPALEVRDADALGSMETVSGTSNERSPASDAPNSPDALRLIGPDSHDAPAERAPSDRDAENPLHTERLERERLRDDRLLERRDVSGADDNPLDRVAGSISLREHLRSQVGQALAQSPEIRADLLRYLIETVDERGYLVADTDEATERFRATRTDVEAAIQALQGMDPAGVGARDLRECLTLQARFLDETGEGHPLAVAILTRCWDELIAKREERIAARLKVTTATARAALVFLQRALTPYPGGSFRPDGATGTGGDAPIRPDLILIRTEAGYSVELARDFEAALTVAPLWRKLADGPERTGDDAMRRYVRDHVDRAQSFLTGVARRGKTLRAIAREIVRLQVGFLDTRNRAFLRPLTRQTLAETLGLDESVISRAVADKWMQLPSGEILPLDIFFGNSQAVREALVTLIASENPENPYSDDEIADRLTEQGFPLARRTVAKYRGLERILPARLRKRTVRKAA